SGVGRSGEKPDELMDDRSDMQLLRRDERKALREIETHLVAEHAERAGAGAVGLARAVVSDTAEKVEILLHAFGLARFRRTGQRDQAAGSGTTVRTAISNVLYAAWQNIGTLRLPVRTSSHDRSKPIPKTSTIAAVA